MVIKTADFLFYSHFMGSLVCMGSAVKNAGEYQTRTELLKTYLSFQSKSVSDDS